MTSESTFPNTPTSHLVSERCSLETQILSPAKYDRLSRRRWRKKAAARRLEKDLIARATLPIVVEEIRRRYEEPISNIETLHVDDLLRIRGEAEAYVLDPMGQVRAMMSTLGTFEGDHALEADEKARCWIRQINRELDRRGKLAC